MLLASCVLHLTASGSLQVVAPESCRHCYSERLAIMPNCYFVNDYKQAHLVRTGAQSATRPGAAAVRVGQAVTAGWQVLQAGKLGSQTAVWHACSVSARLLRPHILALDRGLTVCAADFAPTTFLKARQDRLPPPFQLPT